MLSFDSAVLAWHKGSADKGERVIWRLLQALYALLVYMPSIKSQWRNKEKCYTIHGLKTQCLPIVNGGLTTPNRIPKCWCNCGLGATVYWNFTACPTTIWMKINVTHSVHLQGLLVLLLLTPYLFTDYKRWGNLLWSVNRFGINHSK